VLRNRLGGIEAATYPDGPRTASIRVELARGELTADFLDRTQMRTAAGTYVPLADIVTVDRAQGFSTVGAKTACADLGHRRSERGRPGPRRAVMKACETVILPAGREPISASSPQLSAWPSRNVIPQRRDDRASSVMLGIYLVLAWIFASWTRPMVVMAIIPFGLVGTIYGHWCGTCRCRCSRWSA
jgi:hypothetical protein